MKKGRIILGAITGLLTVGAVFAFKAAKFVSSPNVYYFTSGGRCTTVPYTTNPESEGTAFTITTTGYYTLKVNANSCSHAITATPSVVKHTTID